MEDLFKTSTSLYDALADHMDMIAKKDLNMKKLVKIIQFINDKNTNTLNTNIVGYSLLINEKDQENIFDCLELKKKNVADICKKSPRLAPDSNGSGIGKILDQFSFALPLLLLAGALHRQKKEALAQGVFLFTFYRPYASKITTFFRLGIVDEKAMEYTTMIELNNKSYITKYGSVYAVLVASAKSTYTTYIDNLAGVPNKPTDDFIYNNIFYSSIFSKTGSWIKGLYGAYKRVKASGKALQYEQSYYTSYDDDSGDDQVEENNINSNSSVKRAIASKAINKFNISPIDNKLISISAAYGNGSPSKLYENFLTQVVGQVFEQKNDTVPAYFDAIVGSFLDSEAIDGTHNSPQEISTLKFLAYSKKIFKTSHTNNINIREEQNITEDILTSFAPKYINADPKTKRKMKLALYMYFVLFIQKA